MNNDAMENALVGQKNEIIGMINAARDAAELRNAANLIRHNSALWIAVGYGYKLNELKDRIHAAASRMRNEELDYLKPLRKNARTRYTTERHCGELANLMHDMR